MSRLIQYFILNNDNKIKMKNRFEIFAIFWNKMSDLTIESHQIMAYCFIPVLPGPCGLYRSNDILGNKFSKDGNAINWYFNIVNAVNGFPNENGLILGNLSIAEDRVLTYASILQCENNFNPVLAYVPNALFYFEAETSMDKFVYQRRRWIDGTFAGYVFLLLTQPWHLWNW